MQQVIYDTTKFGGIILNASSTLGQIINCDNFDPVVDRNNQNLYYGFLTKFPLTVSYGSTVTSSSCLGLFLFVPSDYADSGAIRFIQAFSDGTVRYLNSDTWTTLNSGMYTSFPYSFAVFSALNKVFWSNGRQSIYKWNKEWSAGATLKDKSATQTALTGTLTWNATATVTGAGTTFTTELATGDWIRRSSTSLFWDEVKSVENNTSLTLMYASSDTGAGAAGGSQKSAACSLRGRFLKAWKDRLFIIAEDLSSVPLFDVATFDDATTPFV